DTMDDRARLKLKFANPLGVAGHVVDTQEARARAEADALMEDKDTAAAVEAVITGYEQELKAELPSRLAEIDNILARLKERGLDFFDNTIRLTRIMDLSRGDKIRAEFERQVLADVPGQV